MNISTLSILIALIFCIYTFFESLSGIARYSGFKIGALTVGVALQNQVLSLNRFLGFLIAPLVGFYADTNNYPFGIAFIGILGSTVGTMLLILGYRNWKKIGDIFARIAISFLENGYKLSSLKKAFSVTKNIQGIKGVKLRKNYFFAQMITTGFAMPAVFTINIVAINYDTYSATILQLTSVISGMGNLLLNFYTLPLLSVEENNNPDMADNCYKSIYLGKIIGLGVLSPVIISTSLLI